MQTSHPAPATPPRLYDSRSGQLQSFRHAGGWSEGGEACGCNSQSLHRAHISPPLTDRMLCILSEKPGCVLRWSAEGGSDKGNTQALPLKREALDIQMPLCPVRLGLQWGSKQVFQQGGTAFSMPCGARRPHFLQRVECLLFFPWLVFVLGVAVAPVLQPHRQQRQVAATHHRVAARLKGLKKN